MIIVLSPLLSSVYNTRHLIDQKNGAKRGIIDFDFGNENLIVSFSKYHGTSLVSPVTRLDDQAISVLERSGVKGTEFNNVS